MRNNQGSIPCILGLLTEDGVEKLLLWSVLSLCLWSCLTNKDVS